MLIHDFGLVEAEKEVHLDDNLILYIIDTLKWVKTFSKLENNIEKNGLNYGYKEITKAVFKIVLSFMKMSLRLSF